MNAVVNYEHVRITQASHDLPRLPLVVSGVSLVIVRSGWARRLSAISSRAHLACCLFVALILFFQLSTLANAQYTQNLQTNVISGVVSNWVGSYLVGSNTFGDVSLIQNGGVLSTQSSRLGYEVDSSNNSVLVSGSASVWNNAGILVVGYQGTSNLLQVGGGSVYATNLVVGFASSSSCSNNVLQLDSGTVVVTNATHSAVLEIRYGTLLVNGGTLQVDNLIMTNACGLFLRYGGTLMISNLVLDPGFSAVGDGILNGWKQQYGLDPLDPALARKDLDGTGFTVLQNYLAGTDPTNSASALRILGMAQQGDDVLVTWQAGGGRTNVLQAARSLSGVFFNVSPAVVIPNGGDVVTNYPDKGGAINSSSRFYCVAVVNDPAGGTTAPTLTITSPTNDSYITNSTLTVTGTSASASGISGVEVQGTAASSTDGFSNWVAAITISSPCTNTVTVLAGDNAAPANITTNSVRVIYTTGTFDCNGDGLPDLWQIQYFGSVTATNAQPTADPNGDGLSTLEDYLLGIDPLNPNSFGDGISDGPLVPPGSGLQPGPNPHLVVADGSVCYPFSGAAQVTIGMRNMGRGPALCPFLRVSPSPTMSPSTVFDTTGGPVTYTLTESYSHPTNDIYAQYADAGTNAMGGVIHKTIPFFFEPGSARYAAMVAVDTNLAAAALDTNSNWWATNVAIYAGIDNTATNYVRNTNCWAYGFDLTCIAVYNSTAMGSQRAGTLISPRHVVFANHYSIANGAVLRFVANDNTVVSRVLSNSVQVGSTDLRIGILDSDVPTNLITFARVLPSSFTNYFPNSLMPISSTNIPALCLDQNEDALESDISAVTTGISFKKPADATRSLFYKDKTSGDSGQPAFIILNGQLVLLTVFTYGGAGSGWFIPGYLNQINSAMTALGGGYSLTQVDLSPFAFCNGGSGQTP